MGSRRRVLPDHPPPYYDDGAVDDEYYAGEPYMDARMGSRRAARPHTERAETWIGLAMIVFLTAIALTALGIAIWAVIVATDNRRSLDNSSSDMVMRSMPTEQGHSPRWDTKSKAWVAGHAKFAELQDVRMGSKRLPLEDGDVLRWQRGEIVNSRDRLLEQELGHHFDTKFNRLQNGHIIIRNETSGQWRNAPLSTLLALEALSDVDMRPHNHVKGGPPDQSRFEYDRRRGKWTVRSPIHRAWLRFCVPPESDPLTTWGRFEDPLRPGQWVLVHPTSPSVGLYLVDMVTRGGMRASRKRASITTPPPNPNAKSSLPATYRIQATVSAANMPPGAWGFLVGGESTPPDGGFRIESGAGMWSIESVREVMPGKEISLAYRMDEKDAIPTTQETRDDNSDEKPPMIQCMRISVDEM